MPKLDVFNSWEKDHNNNRSFTINYEHSTIVMEPLKIPMNMLTGKKYTLANTATQNKITFVYSTPYLIA